MSLVRSRTRSQVIRVKPPLTLGAMDTRRTHLHDFGRLRRWLGMRHALGEPAPAKAIACRLGLSVLTVRALIEAYQRQGPDVMEPPGKGRRHHASLSVEAERTVLAPCLAARPAGPMALVRTLQKALEEALGPRVATSTVYRLWPRPHWRKGGPRPTHPRRRQAAPAPLKNTFLSESRQSGKPVRRRLRGRASSWPKMQDALAS